MGPLQLLSFRAVRGIYYLAYEQAQPRWVQAVANVFRSDQPFEEYGQLESAPEMEIWDGERKRKTPKGFTIKVVNRKFTSTLEFDNDDVRRDKTGLIPRKIAELGAKAGNLPAKRLTTILEANGNGYDGAAFFATAHNHGGVIDNLDTFDATDPDAPTPAEFSTAIVNSISKMTQFTDDINEPMHGEAREFAILVPAKYTASAQAAVRQEFLAAATSNVLKSTDWQVTVYTNPRLNGTAAAAGRRFYTFRTDASIRALIWQEEDIGAQAFQVHGGEDTDLGFWKDGIAMGPKRVGGESLGRFELAHRTEFN